MRVETDITIPVTYEASWDPPDPTTGYRGAWIIEDVRFAAPDGGPVPEPWIRANQRDLIQAAADEERARSAWLDEMAAAERSEDNG